MEIFLNGRLKTATPQETILKILEDHHLKPEAVAVEVNGLIIEQGRFGLTRLSQGDHVEILHFVGGG